MTQNFNAEYEHASSAIITALTRSGTNESRGDGFIFYQDKSLVAQRRLRRPGEPRPNTNACSTACRSAARSSATMHFFVAFEGNDQDRANRVTLGNPAFEPDFGQYEGWFAQPFRQDLFFGKIDFAHRQADLRVVGELPRRDGHQELRRPDELRSGQQHSKRCAPSRLAHTYDADGWINEASSLHQVRIASHAGEPRPRRPRLLGVIRIGGADHAEHRSRGNHLQERPHLHASSNGGRHAVKTGVRLSRSNTTCRSLRTPIRCFASCPKSSFDFPGRGVVRHRQRRSLRRHHAVRPVPAGRLGDHAAADVELRRSLGLRHGHAQQRLRDAAGDSRRRLVVRAGSLLHRRQRPRQPDRPVPAAHRVLVRPHGRSEDGDVRRRRTLFRPCAVQRDSRRTVAAAMGRAAIPVLGRRSAARRPADDRVERRLSRACRARRADRLRRRAERGDLLDRERHADPGDRAGEPRRAAALRRRLARLAHARAQSQPARLLVHFRQSQSRWLRRPLPDLAAARRCPAASATSCCRPTRSRPGTTACTSRSTSRTASVPAGA